MHLGRVEQLIGAQIRNAVKSDGSFLFCIPRKEERLSNKLCCTVRHKNESPLPLCPCRMDDVFDPMCCPCLIKNPLERDYSTRQGESVEAKK